MKHLKKINELNENNETKKSLYISYGGGEPYFNMGIPPELTTEQINFIKKCVKNATGKELDRTNESIWSSIIEKFMNLGRAVLDYKFEVRYDPYNEDKS